MLQCDTSICVTPYNFVSSIFRDFISIDSLHIQRSL